MCIALLTSLKTHLQNKGFKNTPAEKNENNNELWESCAAMKIEGLAIWPVFQYFTFCK